MREQYEKVDIAKFIAAILVVSRHIGLGKEIAGLSYSWQLVTSLAVPYFFICSSFFLFKKSDKLSSEEQANVVGRYEWRIIKLDLAWSLIWAGYIFHLNFSNNNEFAENVLTLIKKAIFSSTFQASWYLCATIWGIAIIHIITNKLHLERALWISAIVSYGLCIYAGEFTNLPVEINGKLINSVFYKFFSCNIYNSFITGILCLTIGRWIAFNETIIVKNCAKRGLFWKILCIILVVCLVIEGNIFKSIEIASVTDVTILVVPAAMVIFIVTLNNEPINIKKSFSKTLRNISTIIYCTHFSLMPITYRICKAINCTNSFVWFSITIVICILIGYIIVRSASKINLLKVLY